jgi:hypothetical protein
MLLYAPFVKIMMYKKKLRKISIFINELILVCLAFNNFFCLTLLIVIDGDVGEMFIVLPFSVVP